jgi:hypothetical protein
MYINIFNKISYIYIYIGLILGLFSSVNLLLYCTLLIVILKQAIGSCRFFYRAGGGDANKQRGEVTTGLGTGSDKQTRVQWLDT